MRSEVLAGRRKSVHVWVGCGAGGPVCTGSRVRLKAGGARARAGRTQNIPDMSVTVEVSKMLSDWSNDFAACRESRGGHTMRSGLAGRQQGVCGATAAQAACTGKARLKAWGASARTERTRNICCMFLTLDVLKLLSGWLNTVAPCRVKGRAYDAERGAGWEAEECACGAWGGGIASGMHGEGPIQGLRARARAGRT